MTSEPHTGTADPGHIAQLDGLRACAFLAVFLHHALQLPLLWMGVDLFLVLSGFLITRNLLSLRQRTTRGQALAAFYLRRALRILPPYYLVVTAGFLIAGSFAGAGWYYAFASNVRDAINGASPGQLGTLWSIAIEEQFYLVWPWLVLLVPHRRLGLAFAAVLVAAPLCRIGFTPMGFHAVYRLTVCRMDLLAAGAVLALIEQRDPGWFARNLDRLAGLAAIAVTTLAALSLAIPTFRMDRGLLLFNVVGYLLAAVAFTCLLGYLRGASSGKLLRALRHPVLRYLGRISYMAYLLHVPCISLAYRIVEHPVAATLLGLALTIAGASASWYAVEAPLLTLRRFVQPRPVGPQPEAHHRVRT